MIISRDWTLHYLDDGGLGFLCVRELVDVYGMGRGGVFDVCCMYMGSVRYRQRKVR